MTFKFGKTSLKRLATCDQRLQDIANELIKVMDVSVVCGHRTEAEQNEAFAKGNSKLEFPKSKHNKMPSIAIDLAPVKNGKIDWNDRDAFLKMLKIVEDIAAAKGIKIRLGRDFKNFVDLPHVELVE